MVAKPLRWTYYNTVFSRMKADPTVFLIGEGSKIKMSFDAPKILRAFPDRVLTAPVSEAGITNAALGAALNGMHPIVDLTFNDLAFRAMDEIVNQAGKMRFMSAGKLNPRMIIKADFNRPENAQSGNRLESFFLHQRGVEVAIPTNPVDMKDFVDYALTEGGVTMLFEDRLIRPSYPKVESLEFGQARLLKDEGQKLVISYGYTLQLAYEIIQENKMHFKLMDLRTLNPLDIDAVLTDGLYMDDIIIIEPTYGLSVGDLIVAKLAERGGHFGITRIKPPNVSLTAERTLQAQIMPSKQTIFDALKKVEGRP